jgi:hypothetical protein
MRCVERTWEFHVAQHNITSLVVVFGINIFENVCTKLFIQT